MKNKLTDLNNHLFAELERLSDEDLTGDKLIEEINRAKTVANVAAQIINSGSLVLKAAVFSDNKADLNIKLPKMLLVGSDGGDE